MGRVHVCCLLAAAFSLSAATPGEDEDEYTVGDGREPPAVKPARSAEPASVVPESKRKERKGRRKESPTVKPAPSAEPASVVTEPKSGKGDEDFYGPPLSAYHERLRLEKEAEKARKKREEEERQKAEQPIAGTEIIAKWRRDYDPKKKDHYWYHTVTKESQWELPAEVKALQEKKEAAEKERIEREGPDSGWLNLKQCRARGDCATENRITRENERTGAPPTEWDINGAGDPSIQGFATDISAAAGGRVDFKVRTDAASYRVDVYRMGYYQGRGARLVDTVQPHARLPQQQPECYFEAKTLLVDCSNWAVSATWPVPNEAVSGMYFARLVRTDAPDPVAWRADNSPVMGDPKFGRAGVDPRQRPAGSVATGAYGAAGLTGRRRNALREPRASHAYFIVRDDSHGSAVLMQAADTTWQAYNCWGTTNTYGAPCSDPAVHAGSPKPPNTSRRAYKASYNRPFATRAYRATNMPFNAEYPMVRWLERNGYDVTYWAGVDADRYGGQLPGKHRVYLSVGHDEYWSGPQRSHVTRARDAGLGLAFFSGNELYWRVRYEPDASGAAHRTLVVYKDTQSVTKLDPVDGEWTGTFRDGRAINPLGGHPENALTGTIYTVNAWRNDALEVPARFSAHRFWRNTSVAAQAGAGAGQRQRRVLVQGLLGHEWDEDVDNGHRPAGLQRLSSTTVDDVQYLMDEGATYDTGTATHHLTLYRAASGALVFGAGTVQWSWGLDGHHDLVGGSDVRVGQNCYALRVGADQLHPDGHHDIQQATVNLFADMGALPASLQDALLLTPASRDVRAPAPVLGNLRLIRFGEGGEKARLDGNTADEGGGAVAAVELSHDAGGTWHPASSLDSVSGRWTLLLPPGGPFGPGDAVLIRAFDDSGNPSAAEPHVIPI